MRKTPLAKTPLYALMILMALVSLIPFYMLLFTALTPSSISLADSRLLLRHFEWGNLAAAWRESKLGGAMTNSSILMGGSVLLSVLVSAGAGYVFARVNTWYNRILFNVLLFSMMIPGVINTVPLYSLMKAIHGINTHWAMILLLATGFIPQSVFLYANFIRGLSREIEESAVIDGCTLFEAFWRISFPLLLPITSTLIILNAIAAWNNYAQSVFFLQSQELQTVPLAISRFVQTYGADYTKMASAALIGMLPAVIIYFVFQRFFVKGISAGAVKG
ncbi:carbohydrate ABC transporter permease [Cohnella fermenti]|uniref:Carbohydrate ABC transporter permease n=1 Tax=Cohnella fermenti TaxID=2565925 RepID=A0A4S4C6I1_9BACL|nr:carbohydrate ABC transporter permease [Cohnella fermenti]THF83433.1 carbohydrate ABC transporter permease [Cohnella fermenti]